MSFNTLEFESFVNSEEYQTDFCPILIQHWFESFVNSEEYQTGSNVRQIAQQFESFVNSEEYQTIIVLNNAV